MIFNRLTTALPLRNYQVWRGKLKLLMFAYE